MLWCVLSHVVVQLCMFVLRLGFLSTYLSEPIVKAFTSAAAFHVTVSQLQSMLGLRLTRHTGNFALFKVSPVVLLQVLLTPRCRGSIWSHSRHGSSIHPSNHSSFIPLPLFFYFILMH